MEEDKEEKGGKEGGEEGGRKERRREEEGWRENWMTIDFSFVALVLFLIFFFPYCKTVFSFCTNSSGWLRETLPITLCNCYFLLFVWQLSSLLAKGKASLSEAGYGRRECRVSCVEIVSSC